MLKRLYVDNFRCLVDFELNFNSINLLLGDNGTGKSTVFDVLGKLQLLISNGDAVEEVFKQSDLTRWQTKEKQVFELEISGNNGVYKYRLEIIVDNNPKHFENYISTEKLWFNEALLLDTDMEKVEIYSDDGISSYSSRYNFFQSVIRFLKSSYNNQKIIWFRNKIENLTLLKTNPSSIQNESSHEDSILKKDLTNYVSWYRYIFGNNQDKLRQLTKSLQDILEGFISFKLEQISEKVLILKLIFKPEESNQNIEYTFGELSDGQKVLVILYSLFYGLESEDYTLCIDEPENFLALPEIQPWLFQLEDLCSEGKLQALLISHHPQLIDYLLASPIGYWFERQANSAVKVKPITNQESQESGLSMSELITRGWVNG